MTRQGNFSSFHSGFFPNGSFNTRGGLFNYYVYEDLYINSSLARRIVEDIADDSLLGEIIITNEDYKVEYDAHDYITDKIREAIYRSRTTGGSVLYLDTRPQDASLPMEDWEVIQDLVLLEIYQVTVEDRFRRGLCNSEINYITISSDHGQATIHSSRFIVFKGDYINECGYANFYQYYQGFGISVLHRCYDVINRFDRFQEIVIGISNASSKTVLRYHDLKGLQTGDPQLLEDRISELNRNLASFQPLLIGQKDDLINVTKPMSGLGEAYNVLVSNVVQVAEMPVSRLFGASSTGFSTDDQAGRLRWATRIESLRSSVITPAFRKIYRGLGYTDARVSYPPIEPPSKKEEAEILEINIRNLILLVQGGLVSINQARESLKGSEYGNLNLDFEILEGDFVQPNENMMI